MEKSLLYGWSAAWKAECLKLKGSRIAVLIIVMGLAFPVLYFCVSLMEEALSPSNQGEQLTYAFFEKEISSSIPGFGSFFFPLGLILLMTRLIGIEHKADTWKLIETQPISRFSFWSVKLFMGLVLSLVIIVLHMVTALILLRLKAVIHDPGPDATFEIPVSFLLHLSVRLWIAGFGILIVQMALSTMLRNTIWPVVIGVVAMIVMNIVSGNNWFIASTWPYALPAYTARYPEGSEMGFWLLPAETQGAIWLLLVPLAYQLYRNRLRLRSILTQRIHLLVLSTSLIMIGLLTWWVQRPAQLPLMGNKTVIAGSIRGAEIPDSVEVFTLQLEFSLAKVPVNQNGSFHASFELLGGVEQLVVRAGKKFSTQVYAGKGDSLFLDWLTGKKAGLQRIQLRGNAIATNQFLSQRNNGWSLLRFQLDNPQGLLGPEKFYKELLKEWEDKNLDPLRFRTADGLGLSKHIQQIQQKLIAAEYISMAIFEYPSKKEVSLQDSSVKQALKQLQPLFSQVGLFDSSLVGWQVYHDYMYKWLVKDALPRQNKDSLYRAALLAKSPGKMRDRLLYDFLQNRIQQARDSLSRQDALKDAAAINDSRMINALAQKVEVINRLRRGQTAPFFEAHKVDGQTTSLASLKGKYVVIDVWATWCGPCKQQSPIFNNIALKYRNEPIVFLALSVDEDRTAWQAYQRYSFANVLQWRAADGQKFNHSYGVESIPRFILLDPEGRIVNAALPFPSDPNFELMIRQALSLKAEEG